MAVISLSKILEIMIFLHIDYIIKIFLYIGACRSGFTMLAPVRADLSMFMCVCVLKATSYSYMKSLQVIDVAKEKGHRLRVPA